MGNKEFQVGKKASVKFLEGPLGDAPADGKKFCMIKGDKTKESHSSVKLCFNNYLSFIHQPDKVKQFVQKDFNKPEKGELYDVRYLCSKDDAGKKICNEFNKDIPKKYKEIVTKGEKVCVLVESIDPAYYFGIKTCSYKYIDDYRGIKGYDKMSATCDSDQVGQGICAKLLGEYPSMKISYADNLDS